MAEIGDLIPKSGIYTEPGVVMAKNEDGTVSISTEPLDVNQFHRYANTTGLVESDKQQFNEILDQIYTQPDNVERINGIQKEIDRLKTDPKSNNVVQYLRNQQAVLIRDARSLPTSYRWDETQLKR
jgi:hypothetical protein